MSEPYRCPYCFAPVDPNQVFCSPEHAKASQRHERDPLLTRGEVAAILKRSKKSDASDG